MKSRPLEEITLAVIILLLHSSKTLSEAYLLHVQESHCFLHMFCINKHVLCIQLYMIERSVSNMISSSHVYVFGAIWWASNSSAPIGPTTPARPCLVRHKESSTCNPPRLKETPHGPMEVFHLETVLGFPSCVDAGPPYHEWVDLLTSRGFPNQKKIWIFIITVGIHSKMHHEIQLHHEIIIRDDDQ